MIQQAIEKSLKMTALLLEYQVRLQYDQYKFHLVDIGAGCFSLYRIEDQKELVSGYGLNRIKSYARLRSISLSLIYDSKPLEPKPIAEPEY